MFWRELLGWFLAYESILAIVAIFSDDWWEWFRLLNLITAVSIGGISWVFLIHWLITGNLGF